MQIKWNQLKHCDLKGREFTQITFEDDYIIRDSKPDVGEIICVKGMPVLEEQKLMNGSLWLSGKVSYVMLYQEEKGDGELMIMEGFIPFQEKMNIDQLSEGNRPKVRLRLEEVSASIINSRKVAIRGIVEVEAVLERIIEEEINCRIEEEDIQQKIEKERVLCLEKSCNDILRVQKEIQLPKSKSNVGELLFYYVDIRNQCMEYENDGMNLKGEALVCVIYRSEEENIDWYTTSIEFVTELKCGEMKNDEIFWADIEEQNHQLEVSQDYDGEMRQFSLDICFEVSLKSWRETEMEVLKDAYSRTRKIKTAERCISTQNLIVKNVAKIRVAQEMQLEKLKGRILQICGCKSASKIEYCELADDAVHVEGTMQINFLYVTSMEDSVIGYARCQLPFSENIEAKGVGEDSIIEMHSGIDQLQINLLDGESYEIKALVSVELLAMKKREFRMITEAQSEGVNEAYKNIPGIVGYVMQDKEELWDIAKTYCTTEENIRRDNNLEEGRPNPGDRLIIVKNQ